MSIMPPEEIPNSPPNNAADPPRSMVERRKVFFGLFVFPMLIAVTMAILLSGIVLLTHEEETPESLITAIKTGAPSKRWQKAYELANELNKRGIIPPPTSPLKAGTGGTGPAGREVGGGMIRSAGIMNEVIHILNDKEHYDAKTRAYMAMALGRFRNEEAQMALRRALGQTDDSEDPQFPLFLMWSIGNLTPRLNPPPQGGRNVRGGVAPSPLMGEGRDGGVAQEIVRFLESKHDDLRKTAAYVLGGLNDKQVIPQLKRSLEDPVADVRWNSALSLARLGDASGIDTLFQMLDRNHLREVHQMNESEIEPVMVNAAKGLGLIQNQETRSILENVANNDPNLKVRQAAFSALQQPSLRGSIPDKT